MPADTQERSDFDETAAQRVSQTCVHAVGKQTVLPKTERLSTGGVRCRSARSRPPAG